MDFWGICGGWKSGCCGSSMGCNTNLDKDAGNIVDGKDILERFRNKVKNDLKVVRWGIQQSISRLTTMIIF